ncbi:MAG: tetratricopeptide repeat protein [Spirochaetia bacterium]
MTKEDAVRLYKEKQYKEALDGLLGCGVNPHEDTEVALYLGLCYSRVNDIRAAIRLLEFVVNKDQDLLRLTQSRFLLCYLYVLDNREKDAEFVLSEMAKNGRQRAQFYSLWAYVAQKRGDLRLATRRYRMAMDADPTHINTLNGLGFLYAELGENLEEALTLCRQAVSARPNNSAYLDSLGWVLHKMGKSKESLDYLEMALMNSPDSEQIRNHVEVVRKVAGRK